MRYLALLSFIILAGCVAKPVVAEVPPAVAACERHEHLGASVQFDKGFEKCADIMAKQRGIDKHTTAARPDADLKIINGAK